MTLRQQCWLLSLQAGLYHCLRTCKPDGKRPGLAGNTPRADPRQDLLMLQGERERGCRREGRRREQRRHGWGEQGLPGGDTVLQGCSAPLGKQRARGGGGLSTVRVVSPAVLAFAICKE